MKDLLEVISLILFVILLVLLVIVVLLSNIQPLFVKFMISLLIILGGVFIVQVEAKKTNNEENSNSSTKIKLVTPVTTEEYDQIFKSENLLDCYSIGNNIFSLSKSKADPDIMKTVTPTVSYLYIKYPSITVKTIINYSSFYEFLEEIENVFKELSTKSGFVKPVGASDKNFYVNNISIFRNNIVGVTSLRLITWMDEII